MHRYLLDKKFGDSNIRGIVSGLVKAGIDCIEIGFFQDEGAGDGKTVYLNSEDAKRFIPKEKNGCLFTVLADCSRYSVSNLDKCDGTSIDAVRECFFKGERSRAVENCKVIKDKGYKCFVQPVDILGYSDAELIDFLQEINNVEPYCLSIVDTFGSMYQDDLHRIFEIINHNLIPTCKVGFHSHNNMQMSNALSQEFIRMTYGKREIVVDGTISGMGRGAGNTPTELIAQYLVSQREYNYDIDAILDLIDDYMDNIRTKCSWGYSTPYFIAGCYGAHVNNIAYLTQKNSIRSKDIRYILNKIGAIPRKRYDYNLLEKTYVDYTSSEIDDSKTIKELYDELNGNRCDELGIKHVYQGIRNKLEKLHSLVDDLSECAYIGDDILDLQCMEPIKEARGIVGCPADAAKKVLKIADFISKKDGGNGAVREFIEWLEINK